jgi:hypothetical protein
MVDYASQALEKAYGQIGDIAGKPTALSPYTERTGPVQMDYGVQYQGVNPYQTTGTNYNDYLTRLQAPVTQAYQQNLRDIQSQMGTTGLMGSRGYGMADDTLSRAGESYGRGLLGAEMNAIQQQQEEEKARYAANLAEAQRRQAYGEQQFGWDYGQQQQQADFANQEAARRDAYANQERALAEQTRLEPYEMYSSFAGRATPMSQAQMSSATALQQSQAAQDASNTAGWMNLAGTGVGLLGSTYGDGGWTFSDVGDLFSGWF